MFNEEHRHTSLIATLRERWGLGAPFTARDAGARTFSDAFTLDAPREPSTWPVPRPRPVPAFAEDHEALGRVLSTIGKAFLDWLRGYAEQNNLKIEGLPDDPNAGIPPGEVVTVLRGAAATFFPLLAPTCAR